MLKRFGFFIIFIVSIIWCYSFVFWSELIFTKDIKFVSSLTNNIYLDSNKLNSNIIIFKSNIDISNYNLSSSCNISSKYINNYKSLYFFKVKYKDNNCNNPNLILKRGEELLVQTNFKLNLIKDSFLFDFLVDYETKYLLNLKKSYQKKVDKLSVFQNFSWKDLWKYYKYLIYQRKFNEYKYRLSLVNYIIDWRNDKYIVPISWYKLSKRAVKIPNSSRNYRASYTDWIHHWWDIDTSLWKEVIALDNWEIIRVVNNFSYIDLEQIKKSKNLTYEEKLRNLDILRWNQVWLKTTKGDVVFYSHLHSIPSYIKEWMMVTSWTVLGTVWITWIPDKSYSDYHLHFAIQKNPYNTNKVGSYDIEDYMKWDWYYKWKSSDYIIKNQSDIFDT